MPKRLVWFYNENCEYCRELDPEVRAFAHNQGAELVYTDSAIMDSETGEPLVPALIYEDPKIAYHVFVGRFCLDALRYMLENG